ncbi:hypothetical protein IWW38_003054 [Coemansia aciculifera]|uniref:Uncharacterized protein n=1 Tax=Coemansia aciculifera TaxID=417176 RepID=A0ACC1M3I6_9FUNG|nr:hypothetical protein IWW38_003054 [Coemansia aciculifera]
MAGMSYPTTKPNGPMSSRDWMTGGDSNNNNNMRGAGDKRISSAGNRPEVGETPTAASSSATVAAKTGGETENFNIHGPTPSGGALAGFTDSVDEWARLLQPTKTAGLPELLDRTHTAPEAVFGPPTLEAKQSHPDSQVVAVDSYAADSYNTLAAGDAPGKISEDVWQLVESLSVAEKAGQMQQIHVGQLLDSAGRVNVTAVDYWISERKVGSVIAPPAEYSAGALANVTNFVQQVALAQGSRIPLLFGLQQPTIRNAAVFPLGIATAATFDPRFAYDGGRVAAKDARAAGFQWALAPSAALGVDKRSVAGAVGFGEDPTLGSAMLKAAVRGLQGEYKTDRGRVAACIADFIGSGNTQAGLIPDSLLLEYYLPGAEAAIGAGAATAMQGAASINGEAVGVSGYYLRRLLRDRMSFRGVMVSDHTADSSLLRSMTAANATDATFLALNNTSVDISAGDVGTGFSRTAWELVRAGAVAEDRITESAARIVQLKKDLGLFDAPFADPLLRETVGSKQDVEAARAVVRESVTLLKNAGGVLPLTKNDRVLFIGPHLNSTALLSGNTLVDGGVAGDSVLQGVKHVTGREPVFHAGWALDGSEPLPQQMEALIRVARQADKIVVGLGDTAQSDESSLELDAVQARVVAQLASAVRRPIIALLVEARPRIVRDLVPSLSGVLTAYVPGSHGGRPIAEILYGHAAPSGRLPFTYPRFERQARDTIWQTQRAEYAPQWPFAFGLGYAPLTYSNLTVSSDRLSPGSPVKVTVSVRNDGLVDQKETVTLFSSQEFRTGYEPELYRLRRFEKVEVKRGMVALVEFTLTAEDLAYYNRALERVIDQGPVNLTVAAMTSNERSISINLSA